MNSRCLIPRFGLALIASSSTFAALAAQANADMRQFTLGAQRDANHNQSVLGTLSLPVGQRPWLQFSAGQTRVAQDAVSHKAGVFGAGAGYVGDGWLASFGGTHRRDGERYRQTDWNGAIEWRQETFEIGLDGSYRDARQQGTVATTNGGGTSQVPVEQRIKGGGLGLHGGVMLGAKAKLYGGAMHYNYRSNTRQNGAVTGAGAGSPGGIVGALLGNSSLLAQALSTRASVVSRDEVALSRSLQAGASYRFTDTLTLAAEGLRDKVLDAPGTVRTVQLKAAVNVAPGWQLTPAVGRTRSDGYGGVNFGALSATYAW